MSAGQKKGPSAADTFLGPIWETLEALDASLGVQTRVLMKRATRKGVFVVSVDSWFVADGKAVKRLVETAGEYPTSQATTLQAFLYSLVSEHTLRVEEQRAHGTIRALNEFFGT